MLRPRSTTSRSGDRFSRASSPMPALIAAVFTWSACGEGEPAAPAERLGALASFSLTGTNTDGSDYLVAQVPIADVVSTVTESMEASWDNALRRLTEAPVVPQNWTLKYFAGATELARAPQTKA